MAATGGPRRSSSPRATSAPVHSSRRRPPRFARARHVRPRLAGSPCSTARSSPLEPSPWTRPDPETRCAGSTTRATPTTSNRTTTSNGPTCAGSAAASPTTKSPPRPTSTSRPCSWTIPAPPRSLRADCSPTRRRCWPVTVRCCQPRRSRRSARDRACRREARRSCSSAVATSRAGPGDSFSTTATGASWPG